VSRPFLTTGRKQDAIELRGLRADCVVGVYPEERKAAQPLHVDLALFLDTREAAAGAGLSKSLDYARLAGEVRI
jgi:dihydroneopterin aldolase